MPASSLGAFSAFAAGAVSFLSPCVLPLVPAYVSYMTGQSLSDPETPGRRLAGATLSAFFVLGFSAIFIGLGASATALGRLLLEHRREAGVAGGVVVALFGLAMLVGVERIPGLRRDAHFHVRAAAASPFSAFLLGVAFGFGWTPCIGPILGVILTAAAVSESASAGIRLLAAYSAGLGLPFLLTGAFLHEAAGRWRDLRRFGAPLMRLAGAVMLAMGIAMATGGLSRLGYWLLDRFPILGHLG